MASDITKEELKIWKNLFPEGSITRRLVAEVERLRMEIVELQEDQED